MAEPTHRYFATLTKHVQDALNTVSLERLHFNPDRVIWETRGVTGRFDIRLKEIINQSGRMYSYYVIKEGAVVVGFDNYPDRRALREKYGVDYHEHLGELIPHKHNVQKASLELTEEMTIDKFLIHLQNLLHG